MVGIRTRHGERVHFFKALLIFFIFSLHVGCKGEFLRPHPHAPTTQPTQHTLDRPPLADTPLAPSPSPTHAMTHLGRAAWRAQEATQSRPIKKSKKSPISRPPPGDGQWRVSHPKPPPPQPRPQQTPSPRYTLRQPKLFYLKTFLGLVARGARASGAACVGEGGRGGVCLLEEECVRGGGTPSLPCNEGNYATCCLAFVRGCGGETVTNRTYWTQPTRLNGGATCTLRVQKISTAICYIRLDLHVFQLAPPTLGHCNRDHLALSGQNINSIVPRLCGTNSGQHLYVGVGRVLGPLELVVTTLGEEPGRRWEIEVTQVECCGEGAPPDGCLQYYASPQGSFASFNYLPNGSSQYLNNLNYVVCVARAAAFCSITYTAGDKMDNTTFQMVNFSLRDDMLTPTVTPGEAGVGVVPCRGDYVVMAGTRLCGDRLNDGSVEPQPTDNGPVTDSTSGPFLVQVMSDSQFIGRGFNLTYHQNPC